MKKLCGRERVKGMHLTCFFSYMLLNLYYLHNATLGRSYTSSDNNDDYENWVNLFKKRFSNITNLETLHVTLPSQFTSLNKHSIIRHITHWPCNKHSVRKHIIHILSLSINIRETPTFHSDCNIAVWLYLFMPWQAACSSWPLVVWHLRRACFYVAFSLMLSHPPQNIHLI